MDLKNFRMTMELLPLLLEMLEADEEWVASLTDEQKQELVDKANNIIQERFGN